MVVSLGEFVKRRCRGEITVSFVEQLQFIRHDPAKIDLARGKCRYVGDVGLGDDQISLYLCYLAPRSFGGRFLF